MEEIDDSLKACPLCGSESKELKSKEGDLPPIVFCTKCSCSAKKDDWEQLRFWAGENFHMEIKRKNKK